MNWYLGTNFGHGSSAAAVTEDGVVAFAIEEGRIIGEKDTSRFPTEAIRLTLEEMRTPPNAWGEGWNPVARFLQKGVSTTARFALRDPLYLRERLWREGSRIAAHAIETIRRGRDLGIPKPTGHHAAHAYSLLPWGLQPNTLVFVSDCTGERDASSAFYWDGSCLKRLRSTPFPHSLGAAYHQAAIHLGYEGRTAPGMLMALSGHGCPRYRHLLEGIAEIEDGRVVFDRQGLPTWRRRGAWRSLAESRPNEELSEVVLSTSDSHEEGRDFAASVQEWFTDLTWKCIASNVSIGRDLYGFEINHIALAGGCALNCQTNSVVRRRAAPLGLGSVFISPWSDDSGTAIGAAVQQALLGGCTEFELATPFLGPFSTDRTGVPCDEESVAKAIDALCNGAVIGLVSGRLEFGPRALGGRCLLADPSATNIKERLNSMKQRPQFMPFAPVVHPADVARLFKGHPSTNMAWTIAMTSDCALNLPGISHPTLEARVQRLEPGNTPLLHRVLSGFRDRTGIGVLMLTSLNGSGEAIPARLIHAINIARRLGTAGVLSDKGWISFDDGLGKR